MHCTLIKLSKILSVQKSSQLVTTSSLECKWTLCLTGEFTWRLVCMLAHTMRLNFIKMAWQEGCCVKLHSLWLQHSGERVRARPTPLSLSPPTEKRIEQSQSQDSHSLGTLSCITQGHTKRTPDGKLVSRATCPPHTAPVACGEWHLGNTPLDKSSSIWSMMSQAWAWGKNNTKFPVFGSGRPQTLPNQQLYFCFRPVDRLGYPWAPAAQDPGAREEKPPGTQDDKYMAHLRVLILFTTNTHYLYNNLPPSPKVKVCKWVYTGEHLRVGRTQDPGLRSEMSSALCSPPLHHGGWLWELSPFPEETRPQKGVGHPGPVSPSCPRFWRPAVWGWTPGHQVPGVGEGEVKGRDQEGTSAASPATWSC